MELLLSLVWLTLAVPVIVLCWRAPQTAWGSRKHQRSYFFVLTICLLALLFPVVSASDDLCAMQVEFEEAGGGRTTTKSAGSDSSSSHHQFSTVAAVVCPASLGPQNEPCGEVSQHVQALPEHVVAGSVGDRAPPLS